MFEGIGELARGHTSHSKFKLVVEHFQDSKNNFEMEANVETEKEILSSVKNLFRFEKIDKQFRFENSESIDKLLKQVERFVQRAIWRMERNWGLEEQKLISPRFESKFMKDEELLKVLSFESALDKSREGLVDVFDGKIKYISEAFESFKEKYLKSKTEERRGRERRGSSGESSKIESVRMSRFPDLGRCYFAHKSDECLFVAEAASKTLLFGGRVDCLFQEKEHAQEKYKQRRLKRIFRRALDGDPVKHESGSLNYLGTVEGKVRNLEISPSDRFIVIEVGDQAGRRFFEMRKNGGRAELAERGFLSGLDIRDFTFVDDFTSEKLVFVDSENKLHVVSLEQGRIEHTFDTDLPIRSVFYIDPGNVLVLSTSVTFAVCSLKLRTVSAPVSLEGNLSEKSRCSYLSNVRFLSRF